MITMGQVIDQGEIVLSWSRKKKKSPLLVVKDWGFCATGFGKKKEFCCGEEPIRVRLNSEKVEDGSAVFTFYEEPVAETLRLPWWLQCG